jgi:glycosyltransferase involved in cell wall biosynthesis
VIRLVHVITDLDTGGAEMALHKLLSRLDRSRFDPVVVSLTDIGPVGKRITSLGVPVEALGMRRGIPDPLAVPRLARRLKDLRPQVVQTWMYHADLIGGLASRLAGGAPIAWNIRHSDLPRGSARRLTLWTARVCAVLSRGLPRKIVCCSEASREVHVRLGYAPEKMVVIPNGFDLGLFRPDPVARLSVRKELGIPDGAPLVGLVARFHPQKDHRTFVRAAGLLRASLPGPHFLLCGERVDWDNDQLARWIDAAGGREGWHLLGLRTDVPRLVAALDVSVSSSFSGEGFPNVIGEAMAAGVPCVVTDVGDSAQIVGQTGTVVQPRDPGALAGACERLLGMAEAERGDLGLAARRRVVESYDLEEIVRRYEDLYQGLAS